MHALSRLSSLVVLLSVPAAAGQVQYSVQVPVTPVPFTTSVNLPQFDPALGFLRYATLQSSALVSGSIGVENLSMSGSLGVEVTPVVYVQVTSGSLYFYTLNPAWEAHPFTNLLPFDGVQDYGGLSGLTTSFAPSGGTGGPTQSAPILTPTTLAAFVGTPGAPGSVSFMLNSSAATQTVGYPANPPPNYAIDNSNLQAQVQLTLTYEYDPVSAKFCGAGLPSAGVSWYTAPCPCNNFPTGGAFTNGCANSMNPSGAGLDMLGTPSLAADTVQLAATGMANGLAIFVQTDAFAYPPVAYGDGVRCFTGNLVRLGQMLPSAGAASYPSGAQLPVAQRGQVLLPGPRYYTAYYRNAAAYCTSATFNATNSLAIIWQP